MKNILLPTIAAFLCSFLHLTAEENPYSGRVQYIGLPGSSETALAHVGPRIPQSDVRVGPSAKEGIGLAFLVAVEVHNDNARNALIMANKVEFIVDVKGVDTYTGAPPSALQVAFLGSAIPMNEWANYAAWNKAPNFEVIGRIEADPEAREYRFDVTDVLANSPSTSEEKPLIYFAIYSPMKDLVEANAGKHVLLEASDGKEPRIEIFQ